MDIAQISTNHRVMYFFTLLITANSTSFGETNLTPDADQEEELSFKSEEIINEDAETSSDTVGDEVTQVVQMLTEVSTESGELINTLKKSMEEELSFREKDSAETEADLDTPGPTASGVLVETTTDAFTEPGTRKNHQIEIIYIETRGESTRNTWIIIGTVAGIAAVIFVIIIVILIIYQTRKRSKSKTTRKRDVEQQLIERDATDPATMDTSTMDTSVMDPLKTNSST